LKIKVTKKCAAGDKSLTLKVWYYMKDDGVENEGGVTQHVTQWRSPSKAFGSKTLQALAFGRIGSW